MAWMIYGATGFTAKLIIAKALARGHRPILAGRHPQHILEISRAHDLPCRVFDLRKPSLIARQLDGLDAVLNCAGPFSATAAPMLAACIEARVPYLDISGEISVFESVFSRDAELRAARIPAISGVGFDVVPSDCLAAMLAQALPRPGHGLVLALKFHQTSPSPGTLKTLVEAMGTGPRRRQDGKIVNAEAPSRGINFPDGETSAMAIPWGDIATAFRSTGIPNIDVYVAAPAWLIAAQRAMRYARPVFANRLVQKTLQEQITRHYRGPTPEQRQKGRIFIWGEARTAHGDTVVKAISTPDGYNVTADAAVLAVEKLLGTSVSPGALTPAQAFGADFVKELEGVELLS